jgi:hypothetical protein
VLAFQAESALNGEELRAPESGTQPDNRDEQPKVRASASGAADRSGGTPTALNDDGME